MSILTWLKEFLFDIIFLSTTIGVDDISFKSVLRKCETLNFRVSKKRVYTTRKLKCHPIIGEMFGKENFSSSVKSSKTEDKISVFFTSDYTTYWGFVRWRLLIITRIAGIHNSQGGHDSWIQKDGEKITISTINIFGAFKWIRGFFIESIKDSLSNEQNKDTIFVHRRAHWIRWKWEKNTTINYSTVKSTILKNGLWETIISDVEKFKKSKELYKSNARPYRMGIMLNGPPGTGKTSVIKALAKFINFRLALLRISESDLSDEDIRYLFQELPKYTIMVLEDIDEIIDRELKHNFNMKKSENKYTPVSGVTMSGVLNVIDGIEQRDDSGLIIIATTNNINKIPSKLRRKGRFDKTYHINYADEYQAKKLFEKIIGVEKLDIFEKIKDCLLKKKEVPCVNLQNLFMDNVEDPSNLLKIKERV